MTFLVYMESVLTNVSIQTSQVTLSAMINATELLQSHNRKLNQASSTASGIHENLERAAATAMVFNSQGSFGDWALRALVPLSTLIVGSFRATPTLAQNMGLLSGGRWLTSQCPKAC
jgi:hypothetical protein